jgi:hypothetical protein
LEDIRLLNTVEGIAGLLKENDLTVCKGFKGAAKAAPDPSGTSGRSGNLSMPGCKKGHQLIRFTQIAGTQYDGRGLDQGHENCERYSLLL